MMLKSANVNGVGSSTNQIRWGETDFVQVHKQSNDVYTNPLEEQTSVAQSSISIAKPSRICQSQAQICQMKARTWPAFSEKLALKQLAFYMVPTNSSPEKPSLQERLLSEGKWAWYKWERERRLRNHVLVSVSMSGIPCGSSIVGRCVI